MGIDDEKAKKGTIVEVGKAWFMGKGLQPDEWTGRTGTIQSVEGDEALVYLDAQKQHVWLVLRRLTPITIGSPRV